MKVVFVYPAFENLGIQYLSAVLRREGHETELAFDPQLFDDLYTTIRPLGRLFSYRRQVIEAVLAARPDLVCFSPTTDIYPWALDISLEIKRRRDVPIAFGGIHTTSVPDRVMARPWIDFACTGEGEWPLLELVTALARGRPADRIPNLWARRNGEVVANPPRDLNQNLDDLPFPDKELFYRAAPYATKEYNLITLRGCLNGCAYCHNSVERRLWNGNGSYLRRRSVGNVLQELTLMRERYGFDTVKFWDEIFTASKEWLREFADRYRREVGLPFWCFVHPKTIDAEVVALLKHAGCWEAEMGVQTLNPGLRKLIGRPEDTAQVAECVRLFREAGIRLVCDHIFGLPGQTRRDLEDILDFHSRHVPNRVNVFWLRCYPRTPVVDMLQKLGRLNQEEIAELEEGRGSRASVSGGTKPDSSFDRFQTACILLPYLPRRLLQVMVRRRLYRFLPSIRTMGHIISRMLNWKMKHDVGGRRYYKHYRYFLGLRLRRWLGWRGGPAGGRGPRRGEVGTGAHHAD